MNIPCFICNPCDELIPPYINLSAELPDQYFFWGTYFGNPQQPPRLGSGTNPNPPDSPGTPNWTTSFCLGFCESSISQLDADACAANASLAFCDPNQPPGNDGNPPGNQPYPIYYNTRQVCGGLCSDGTTPFSFEVPAGTYSALSQALANQIAYSIACKYANLNRHCPPANSVCPNVPLPTRFDTYSVKGSAGPVDFNFAVTSGSLPAGVSLLKTSNTTARLVGTPTQPGYFNWVVTASFMGFSISYPSSMAVFCITNPNLPAAVAGQPYSYQLLTTGSLGTVTFEVDVDPNNPPFWLTLSASGLITGTPSNSDIGNTFDLSLRAIDSK